MRWSGVNGSLGLDGPLLQGLGLRALLRRSWCCGRGHRHLRAKRCLLSRLGLNGVYCRGWGLNRRRRCMRRDSLTMRLRGNSRDRGRRQ